MLDDGRSSCWRLEDDDSHRIGMQVTRHMSHVELRFPRTASTRYTEPELLRPDSLIRAALHIIGSR